MHPNCTGSDIEILPTHSAADLVYMLVCMVQDHEGGLKRFKAIKKSTGDEMLSLTNFVHEQC